MAYPRDIDEYSALELFQEIERRLQRCQRSVCDYCERESAAPPCKFPDRHYRRETVLNTQVFKGLRFEVFSRGLAVFREINESRCKRWHQNGERWTLADWGNALAGEVGEACNIIKKLRRYETKIKEFDTEAVHHLYEALGKEIADIFCYLDLLSLAANTSFAHDIRRKFNEVSERENLDERL